MHKPTKNYSIKKAKVKFGKIVAFFNFRNVSMCKEKFANVEFYVLQRINDSLHICN